MCRNFFRNLCVLTDTLQSGTSIKCPVADVSPQCVSDLKCALLTLILPLKNIENIVLITVTEIFKTLPMKVNGSDSHPARQ